MKKIIFFFPAILILLVLISSSVLAQEDQEHAGEGRCYSDSSLPGCYGNSDGVPPPGEPVPAVPSAPSAPSVVPSAPAPPPVVVQAPPVMTQPVAIAPVVFLMPEVPDITNINRNINQQAQSQRVSQSVSQNNAQVVNIPSNVGSSGSVIVSTANAGGVRVVDSPRVVLSGATQLPKTGLPELAWGLAGLAPVGYSLKRFGQSFKSNSTSAYYVWEKRRFKLTP